MKSKIFIFSLLSLISLLNCSYYSDQFLQALNNEVYLQKWSIPKKLDFFLRDVRNIKVPMTISYVIQKGKVPDLVNVGIPQFMVDFFKDSLNSNKTETYTLLNLNMDSGSSNRNPHISLTKGVGAIKVKGNEARFAYVEVSLDGKYDKPKIKKMVPCDNKQRGKVVMQYCPKVVERELNPEEIHYLRQLIAKECNNALSGRIKDLADIATDSSFLSQSKLFLMEDN